MSVSSSSSGSPRSHQSPGAFSHCTSWPLSIVSPTLFNAHALPADPADTHLQPGIHLRVDAHPLLGLPVAPYIVWRAVLRDGRQVKLRDDVVFVEAIPLGATGKMLKTRLRELLKDYKLPL